MVIAEKREEKQPNKTVTRKNILEVGKTLIEI
jgi:hypothetical protein